MSKKLQMVCSECGSLNVLRDAFAEWDHHAQEWVLRSVFDDSICDDCGETRCIKEVEIEDAGDDDGPTFPWTVTEDP